MQPFPAGSAVAARRRKGAGEALRDSASRVQRGTNRCLFASGAWPSGGLVPPPALHPECPLPLVKAGAGDPAPDGLEGRGILRRRMKGLDDAVRQSLDLEVGKLKPQADGSLLKARNEAQRMAADLDGLAATMVAPPELSTDVETADDSQDWATHPDLWLKQPLTAHERWMRSPGVNGGRGFGKETIKVYGAMWGKFVRFCQEHQEVSAALADERAVRDFLDTLHQKRLDEAASVSGQVRQRVRGRDAGGAKRQARRYLQLLARIQALLMNVGVRDAALGNSAQVLLDQFGAEPDRPIPAVLPPDSQVKLRTQMGEATSKRAASDWRLLRDRAIVELIVGSGLTSWQLRHLRVGADHLDLQASPPYVQPVAARRGHLPPNRMPLSREAAHTLRLWLKLREGHIPGDVLFPSTGRGNPMSAASLYRAVAKSLRDAERQQDMPLSEHLGPRTLRHTFATRQLSAGRPLDVLQRWLGHHNLRSTNVYEKLVPPSQEYEPV